MRVAIVLLTVIALALSGAAVYLYNESADFQSQAVSFKNTNADLENRVADLENSINNMEQEKAGISSQVDALEEEKEKLAAAKDEEINKLKGTYDTLVKDMEKEIKDGQIKITQLSDSLSVSMVDKILFPSGGADITAKGVKVLQRVGNVLKKTKNKVIRVEGHTDNIPISKKLLNKYPTNWELSTTRATNVVKFLQENVGIAPKRLEAVGMSEYHPKASNKTAKGRSRNRRIEIKLLPMPVAEKIKKAT